MEPVFSSEDVLDCTIQDLFVYYDRLYFESTLGACSIEWSPQRMTRCAGICYGQAGGGCIIRLSEPLLRLRPVWELKNTLLHECIHAYLMTHRIREGNGGHGPAFLAKAADINSSTVPDFQRPAQGYNITVFHTMHEEVNFYRQHHWLCKKCGKLIRRAMNRPPQLADCRNHRKEGDCGDPLCGHHTHERTCGGSFTKVKEPEVFTDQKNKRKREADGPAQRPRLHPDKSRSITDFFKGATANASASVAGTDTGPSLAEIVVGEEPEWRDAMRRKLGDAAVQRLQHDDATAVAGAGHPSKIQQVKESMPEKGPSLKQPDLRGFFGSKRQASSDVQEGEAAANADTKHSQTLYAAKQRNSEGSAGEGMFELQDKDGNSVLKPLTLESKGQGPQTHCPICGRTWEVIANNVLNAHIDSCLMQEDVIELE